MKEMIAVKGNHLGGALIQYDWCPCKKRKRHQGRVSTEINDVRTQSANQGEKPQKKPTLPAPGSGGQPASGTMRLQMSVV